MNQKRPVPSHELRAVYYREAFFRFERYFPNFFRLQHFGSLGFFSGGFVENKAFANQTKTEVRRGGEISARPERSKSRNEWIDFLIQKFLKDSDHFDSDA